MSSRKPAAGPEQYAHFNPLAYGAFSNAGEGLHQQLASDKHDEAARMGRLRIDGTDLVLTCLPPTHSILNKLVLNSGQALSCKDSSDTVHDLNKH